MPIVIILTVIALEVLLIFVHLAVYATLAAAFGIGGVLWETIFIILALTFVSATVLSRFYSNRLIEWYYTFAAYWFGLVHFLFVGSLIFYFTMVVSYALNFYPPLPLLGAICFGGLFLLYLYSTWNSGRAEITKIKVTLPNLPAPWKGRTIVFISDVHLGNVRGKRFTAMIAKKITALAPWALFIGGDLYDGTKCDENDIIAPLRTLRLPGGRYFVTGNHEYYLMDGEIGKADVAVHGAGIRVLHDEKIDLDGVQLVGIDDKSVHEKGNLQKILDGMALDKNAPSIFLRHIPFELDVASEKGFSLGLFGHTHQGQIFPLNLLTKNIYKGYDYGLKNYGLMQAYTSSGVGTWGPPLRLGTKSEIVLMEFN